MGCTNQRMNPKVVQQVNREIDSLFIDHLSRAIKKLNQPWEVKKIGPKPHPPDVVTFCDVMKVATSRTYDEIESYVELISEKIKKTFNVDRVPGHSVISTGKLEIFLRAQEFLIPAYIEE